MIQARTLQQILGDIRQRWMDNFTLQQAFGFSSGVAFENHYSPVSISSGITYAVAYCAWIYEQIIAAAIGELEVMIENQHGFSIQWYDWKARQFQLGDRLAFNNDTYKWEYPVYNAEKQIIKQVAIRERQDEGVTKLQIYATKEGRVPLDNNELSAFDSYIRDIGAAGTHFEIISEEPDRLEIMATVYYNPQIISAEGKSFATGEKVVEIAIGKYLEGIVYSGKFNRNKLIDSIQITNGVNDIVLGDVYLNEEKKNEREFESQSGFFTAPNPLITYIPSHAD